MSLLDQYDMGFLKPIMVALASMFLSISWKLECWTSDHPRSFELGNINEFSILFCSIKIWVLISYSGFEKSNLFRILCFEVVIVDWYHHTRKVILISFILHHYWFILIFFPGALSFRRWPWSNGSPGAMCRSKSHSLP